MPTEIVACILRKRIFAIVIPFLSHSSNAMTQAIPVSSVDQTKRVPLRRSVLSAAFVITSVTVFGWYALRQPGYSSGSRMGYNLGLTGAILMLILFLYPLRKHVRWLHAAGPLREWLNFHMLLGICGPLCILFHAQFQIGSVNAAVAMTSMLVVAASGIVGRFIYARIHHELRGKKMMAIELRAELAKSLAQFEGGRALPEKARKILAAFEAYVERSPRNLAGRTAKFLIVGWWRTWTARRLRLQLRGHPGAQRIGRQVDGYLRGLQRVAQFSAYERLFSLWHLLHLPLVVLLVLSASFHVLAVHMY